MKILDTANAGCLANVVLMLAHRLRRWANIKTTLVKRPVFSGRIARMPGVVVYSGDIHEEGAAMTGACCSGHHENIKSSRIHKGYRDMMIMDHACCIQWCGEARGVWVHIHKE